MADIDPGLTYATDGKCHNAEPGTYGHECGKPAAFIGTEGSGFRSGYCADCRRGGWEATRVVIWTRIVPAIPPAQADMFAKKVAVL